MQRLHFDSVGQFSIDVSADGNMLTRIPLRVMLVDKKKNLYRLSEFEPLSEIFQRKIEKFMIPQTIERIKEIGRAHV